jgi:hypothetical protein
VSSIVSDARPAPASPARIVRGMEAWATAAPLLCAAHCAAMPLVVAFAPRLAAFQEHERAVMGAALLLAVLTTVLGVRVHRRAAPLLVAGAGALAWLATFLGSSLPEEALTIAASLLMAAGTMWSARLRHRATCPRCGCAAHAADDAPGAATAGRPAGEEAVR